MHYHAEVWLPSNDVDIDEALTTALAPHEEKYNEDADTTLGFWDWYQIGGRWTGQHVPNYSPERDGRNIEQCEQCLGTGFRNDGIGHAARTKDPSYTCNTCGEYDEETKTWRHGPNGPGKRMKWPTSWARFDGDVISLMNAPADLTCATLIVGDQVFHQEEWTGAEWRKTDFDGSVIKRLKKLGVTDGVLVTVDYHC